MLWSYNKIYLLSIKSDHLSALVLGYIRQTYPYSTHVISIFLPSCLNYIVFVILRISRKNATPYSDINTGPFWLCRPDCHENNRILLNYILLFMPADPPVDTLKVSFVCLQVIVCCAVKRGKCLFLRLVWKGQRRLPLQLYLFKSYF